MTGRTPPVHVEAPEDFQPVRIKEAGFFLLASDSGKPARAAGLACWRKHS